MISKERLSQIGSFAKELRERPSELFTANELHELINIYYAVNHFDGSGPARGSLEHRIEELEGTVAELSKKLEKDEPTLFAPEASTGSERCAFCGEQREYHVQASDGLWCPRG